MSKQCKSCTSTELVYSGTDAFCLGVPTETYCYDCANQIAQTPDICPDDCPSTFGGSCACEKENIIC